MRWSRRWRRSKAAWRPWPSAPARPPRRWRCRTCAGPATTWSLHRPLRRHLESVRQHAALHGITVRFADPADTEAFRRATDDRTRAYYAETLPNPKLTVFPIGEVAAIGRELGVPLIMDNTAAPVICRPFDHGAAIIVHSTTKYIGGTAPRSAASSSTAATSIGRRTRALPDAERARSQLPRRDLDRGGEAAGADRLHHPGRVVLLATWACP